MFSLMFGNCGGDGVVVRVVPNSRRLEPEWGMWDGGGGTESESYSSLDDYHR